MTKKRNSRSSAIEDTMQAAQPQKANTELIDTTNVVFQHTGYPWNDLGVAALWRWLDSQALEHGRDSTGNPVGHYKGAECTLREKSLTISGKEAAVYALLDEALKVLRQSLEQPTKKGNPGLSSLARMVFAGQNTPNFLAKFAELPSKGQWRASGECSECGHKGVPTRVLGTSYNPLLVGWDDMAGFYSELRKQSGFEICQVCAFATPFALNQTWFSYGDNFLSLTLLWPVSSDLFATDVFLRQTSALRLQGETTHNYPHAFGYANSPLSCFLDLVCTLWEQSRTSVSKDVLEMTISGISFHAMQLSKPTARSNVVNVDRVEVIPDPVGILRLVVACHRPSSSGKTWNALVSTLNQMPIRHDDGADTRLLEEAAKAIVGRLPVEQSLESRIYVVMDELRGDPKVAERFFGLAFREFLQTYYEEVKDMAADLLPASQSVGETLGQLVKVTDDRSILYNLRNARNLDDLLEVLSRVIVRHSDVFIAGEVELWRNNVRQLVELIDNSNWRRVRSLLGIYAGLRFIELSSKR